MSSCRPQCGQGCCAPPPWKCWQNLPIQITTCKYIGNVVVPTLEMVDDVLIISKCISTAVALCALVNSFMYSKRLELNKTKCSKIHIGSKFDHWPELCVQGENTKMQEKEKYLGDIIHSNGQQHAAFVEK